MELLGLTVLIMFSEIERDGLMSAEIVKSILLSVKLDQLAAIWYIAIMLACACNVTAQLPLFVKLLK